MGSWRKWKKKEDWCQAKASFQHHKMEKVSPISNGKDEILQLWHFDVKASKHMLNELLVNIHIRSIKGEMNYKKTLSTSQSLTILSNDDVAKRAKLGLKCTSMINKLCFSRVISTLSASIFHTIAYIPT